MVQESRADWPTPHHCCPRTVSGVSMAAVEYFNRKKLPRRSPTVLAHVELFKTSLLVPKTLLEHQKQITVV